MTNPVDDDRRFLVLRNDEGQHSLWPERTPIPAGWSAVHGVDDLTACLAFVEGNWTDLRPASLVAAMGD